MTAAIVHKASYSLPGLAACLGPGKIFFIYFLLESSQTLQSFLFWPWALAQSCTWRKQSAHWGKLQHSTPAVCG